MVHVFLATSLETNLKEIISNVLREMVQLASAVSPIFQPVEGEKKNPRCLLRESHSSGFFSVILLLLLTVFYY